MFRGSLVFNFVFLIIIFFSTGVQAFRGFNQFYNLAQIKTDPYWNDVTVLLRCEGGIIQDMKGHSITNTSVTASTLYSKFGTESCYFDGSAYLDFTASSDFVLGTSDFTIEGWVWTNTNSTYAGFVAGASRFSAGMRGATVQDASALIGEQQVTYEQVHPLSPGFVIGQWQHFAFVRNSGTITFYIDGVVAGSTAATLNLDSNRLVMGRIAYDAAQYYMSGYMDEVRITKGVARYTAAFTPPKEVFPTSISPSDYSGLVLWLDADDSGTITESLGAISKWDDKSSSGLSFTQGTAANKPVLDSSLTYLPKTCINFNFAAANRFLNSTIDLNLTTNFTAFIVGYWPVSVGYTSFGVVGGTASDSLQWGNNTGYLIMYSSPGWPAQLQMIQDDSNVASYSSTLTAIDTKFLGTFIRSGSGTYSIIRNNGAAVSLLGNTITSSTFTVNTLGSTDALYYSSGYIGEILIYNRTLSNDEIQDIESYLKNKWQTP